MALHQIKTSFAGGELSEAMYGRIDINKYDNGAAMLQNFTVLRYGGARMRNGFRHLAKTYDGKRAYLMPFAYNQEQHYVVELTAGHCRFYHDGELIKNGDGTVYAISNTLTDADIAGICKIKYTQSADVMFIVHPDHAPMTLTRYGETEWVWETMPIEQGPFDDPVSVADAPRLTASAIGGSITVSSDKDVFSPYHVGGLLQLTHYKKSEYAKGVPDAQGSGLIVSCLPGASVYVESFGFWDGYFALEKYDIDTGKWEQIRKQDGNRTQNYNFTEKNEDDQIVKYRVTSTQFDTSVWEDENEKQRGYITIQSFGNDYSGIVKITGYSNARSVTGTVVKELGSTEPTGIYAFGAWNSENGYPAAVGFFEDRLVFAGSRKNPQTFWTSKTGDYYNFGVSIPGQDDDAVTATLNGGQMNGIRAMVAFGELILMTAGGEYKVSGNGKAMTHGNVISQAQEYRGISSLNPVTIGSRIVYVQQQGNIVRDLAYSYEADKYTGDDLNLLCSHLFDRHKLVGLAYQQTPDSVVWAVRDDGLLLAMTYLKEQDIYAWTRHCVQDSRFVNICTIGGATEDELYAVLERDGQHYIELLAPRSENNEVADQFYVDDGVSVSGTVAEVSGLDWLENKEVAVLADGNSLPRCKVSKGKISLGNTYSKVHVGLPIDGEIRTMPLEFQGQDGTWLGRKKRVSEVVLLFKDSRGGAYGVKPEKLDEIKWRSTENWDMPIELKTGKYKLVIPDAGWSETQQIIIKQTDPLPMTVLAMVPVITPGG